MKPDKTKDKTKTKDNISKVEKPRNFLETWTPPKDMRYITLEFGKKEE